MTTLNSFALKGYSENYLKTISSGKILVQSQNPWPVFFVFTTDCEKVLDKWILFPVATSHKKLLMRTYVKHLITMESMYEKLQ